MLSNEKLDRESILSSHRDGSEKRFEGGYLLAIQDTMSVNYGTHEKTKGLGYCCAQTLGVNVHSCLLATPSGVPIGLASQSYITRSEASSTKQSPSEKRRRPIEEKESYRWLETMACASKNAPANSKLIHIADREGDIYELFALAQELGEKFIIRIVHDRLDTYDRHMLEVLEWSKPIGHIKATIPANPSQSIKEREALLSVQKQALDIKKPQNRLKEQNLVPSLRMNVIRVWETNPPTGVPPIEWLLVTNLPVDTIEDVMTVVGYYKQRWKIERFHYILKSGCKIESIQQRSVDKVEMMILLYSIISIQIMTLTFLPRSYPDMSCDLIFSESEWKTLYRAANKTRKAPEQPYSMQDAVKYIAMLGGFKGAKSDGAPGLKVIWIGLMNFYLLYSYQDFV
jgi:hypothetical protein